MIHLGYSNKPLHLPQNMLVLSSSLVRGSSVPVRWHKLSTCWKKNLRKLYQLANLKRHIQALLQIRLLQGTPNSKIQTVHIHCMLFFQLYLCWHTTSATTHIWCSIVALASTLRNAKSHTKQSISDGMDESQHRCCQLRPMKSSWSCQPTWCR